MTDAPALPPNERCERCGGDFRCGAADAGPCACGGLTLSAALRAELARRYRHCLCPACLRELAAQEARASIADRIRIVKVDPLSHHWSEVRNTTLQWRRSDGRWQAMQRETTDHGSAAAVLLYDLQRRTVVLVRQFRYATYLDGHDALMLEVPAGLLDGQSPADCVRAEAEQEVGIRVREARYAFSAYVCPGSVTECVHCFTAAYTPADRIGPGGGLEAEGEDIEVLEFDFDDALRAVADGRIRDAKTIMLLQHAALRVF